MVIARFTGPFGRSCEKLKWWEYIVYGSLAFLMSVWPAIAVTTVCYFLHVPEPFSSVLVCVAMIVWIWLMAGVCSE